MIAGDEVIRYARFQSTPLREGRRHKRVKQIRRRRFNPRPCARGDTETWPLSFDFSLFQSTPLREGRPAHLVLGGQSFLFQSTPLREGRPRQ